MKKVSLLIGYIVILLTAMLFSITQSALAATTPTPISIYVDESSTDLEDGTELHPYSDIAEAKAYAEAQQYGGRVYIKVPPDKWEEYNVFRGVNTSAGGITIAEIVVYSLLAIVAFVLIIGGRRLQHRSHQLSK